MPLSTPDAPPALAMRAPAPPTKAHDVEPWAGHGPDAWRFLRRMCEPATYLRAARRDAAGRINTIVEVVRPTWHGPRVLLSCDASAAAQWLAAGWIAAARTVPGALVYFQVTPAGRAAEARLRQDPNESGRPRHLGPRAGK